MTAVSNSAPTQDMDSSTLFGTISFGTMDSESGQGKADDKVTPIVEQIKSRERENQEAVQRIKALLIKDGERCIKMALALQIKKKLVGNLRQQNETTKKELKEAENKSPPQPESDKHTCVDSKKDLEPIQQSLQQILNDLTRDVQDKERYLTDNEKQPKDKGTKSQCEPSKGRSSTDISSGPRKKDASSELKTIVQHWLTKLSDKLRSGKGEPEKLPSFQSGMQKIIKYIDSKSTLTSDHEKGKVKKAQMEKAKSDVHQKVAKRLAERKPLETMSSKIRREFERIAQKREMTEPIPEQKPNLSVYLAELYEWGCKERERDDYRMKQIERQIKESKEKFQDYEKQRNKNTATKNEELKKAEETLTKLEQEKERRAKRLTGPV